METKYNHLKVEQDKYEKWLNQGFFKSGNFNKDPYCIVIPPPNVTGKLHLGHAMDNTLQDLLARFHRLLGYDVLFLPGMDHAGIATQAKVEERLKAENISKYEIGRERFLEKSWLWKKEYADLIKKQWAKLSNSLDYNYERFTLDEGLSKAVNKVFVDYYKNGLIYQGYRIINWDPEAKTALSNIEVIHKEIKGKMYYFKYCFKDSLDYLEVATTRPETMFADVCVVVNQNDERYKKYIGKTVINPANNQEIPIIADDYIDINFGTGVMKCTPAHDPNDYQIALRHNLSMPICMNEDATMNDLAMEFNNLNRFDCREKLIIKIKNEGNFIKEEEIIHSVGHSERTDCIIEPYLSKQWFVKMKPLAESVLKNQNQEATKINFYPKRFENTFKMWLSNIEDWCISRQLWWGHRIPVYYHKKTKEIYCEYDKPSDLENYIQDEDVLDTWFSSALWPFSTLGWPEKTLELKRYFPTTCMVTGYDIIFFWVARMAFSARYFMNDVPFKDCLIHGLIRDEQGRKMSKSLGNGIDPMDIIEKYGTDSLRLYISTNSSPGLDMNYNEEKIASSWNFINKLWNASRYVLLNIDENYQFQKPKKLSTIDYWILNRLNSIIKQVTMNMKRYEFTMAGNELISFIWDDYCSNYIEFSKIGLNSNDLDIKHNTLNTLIYVLEAIVKMLHPYIPFVTEEIYQNIYSNKSICEAKWPEEFIFEEIKDDKNVDLMIEIIKQVREIKNKNNIKPSKILKVELSSDLSLENSLKDIIINLTKIEFSKINNQETLIRPLSKGSLKFILSEIIDKQSEIEKLKNEIIRLEKEIIRAENMLNNHNFINKAPKEKIELEKEKLSTYNKQLELSKIKIKELEQ